MWWTPQTGDYQVYLSVKIKTFNYVWQLQQQAYTADIKITKGNSKDLHEVGVQFTVCSYRLTYQQFKNIICNSCFRMLGTLLLRQRLYLSQRRTKNISFPRCDLTVLGKLITHETSVADFVINCATNIYNKCLSQLCDRQTVTNFVSQKSSSTFVIITLEKFI